MIEVPDYGDPNDPLESVIISMPAFGTGVEHLYGKRSKMRELLVLLNSDGFYRAVPTKLERFYHPAQEGSTTSLPTKQRSMDSVHTSKSSLGSQISQTSLTESQRQLYGLDENLSWPLGSTTNLLFAK